MTHEGGGLLGTVVYDPFCGRGTAPFQALLMNRRAIGNDINAVAYCVTKAKTNAPDLEHVEQRLDLLEAGFDMARWEDAASSHPEFFSYAFAPETFKQLLYLRDSLHWSASDLDCMIAAVVLGILHGDVKSRSYLSNQMPRTISTKPSYSIRYWKLHELRAPVRDVFSLVRQKLLYRYQDRLPPNAQRSFTVTCATCRAKRTRCRVQSASPLRHPLDRKSTRLNSSHGYISYAVFCFKKKTRWRLRSEGSRSPGGEQKIFQLHSNS